MIDLKKLSDVQSVVDSLSGLPKEALFYIAGYAEGWRDKPKRKEEKATEKNDPALNRAGIWRVILCLLGRIFGKFEFQEDLHKWKSRARYEYLIRLFTFGNLKSEFPGVLHLNALARLFECDISDFLQEKEGNRI